MQVTIIGNGWVGKSIKKLFPEAYVYTHRNGASREIASKSDIAFIAVPTPLGKGGFLDTSIVEECVRWCTCPLLVIRSTVNPGDCDRWERDYDKEIIFQPEYLGETPNHPLLNEKKTPFIILGGKQKNTRKLIELYTGVYNANVAIRQVSLKEGEIIKLSENRAIAFKVMQCQELYDVCEMAGVDYYTVRDAVYGDDPRFELWFSFIYNDKRGFNSSKCLKKDVPAFCAWAKSTGYTPKLTRALVERSNEYEKNQIDKG